MFLFFDNGIIYRDLLKIILRILKMNLKKGFTLLELLVVVGIIGILATVVLASLNNAKTKGEDKAVASNLHTVVNQAEIFFTSNNNSYLPAGGSTFNIGICPTYNASGDNMFAVDKVLASAIAEAVLRGSGSACYNSSNHWVVAIGLKSDTNTSWCVDNEGSAKLVASSPVDAINPINFNCN